MKKETFLNQTDNNTPNFWFCGGLLVILLASITTRDITRPFYGLHSWAEASGAWVARVHVKYGLDYTKGLATWAVGNPPTQNPSHYFDHPQLSALTKAGVMAVLGVSEWSSRIVRVITSVLILLLFLKILRGLVDDKTALLSGLIYTLSPLTGYFGLGDWPVVFSFLALWNYLVLIGAVRNGHEPTRLHKYGIAAGLFMALQFGWPGFFYAFAMGLHYVGRCVFHRKKPDKTLLAILIIAPLSSLALNFTVMAAGQEWNFQNIIDLYKWRSAKGEMAEFQWSAWFAKLWEFAVTNFTLPILLTAIVYLTFGQLLVFIKPKPEKQQQEISRQFPLFWLFAITPLAQLLVLRGALWRHQTWERPLGPLIAIAAALGVMLLTDILKKIGRKVSITGLVLWAGVSLIACVIGTNNYYSIRWQPPEKIEMFKMLNQKIPPDKALLSYEPFIVNQNKAKGAFYRPEIAWYLDRDIVPAMSLAEVQKYALSGKYPYYLIPAADSLSSLISQLRQLYKFEYVSGVQGKQTEDGKFLKAGMFSYFIFDLNSSAAGS
ncbi:MAG: glycosyltransferase family 39 protein [Phycisphaerae bacterium]|nr:glycosyltransferase family 39 protein [Phycisphaerae bacterium]